MRQASHRAFMTQAQTSHKPDLLPSHVTTRALGLGCMVRKVPKGFGASVTLIVLATPESPQYKGCN